MAPMSSNSRYQSVTVALGGEGHSTPGAGLLLHHRFLPHKRPGKAEVEPEWATYTGTLAISDDKILEESPNASAPYKALNSVRPRLL